jgi:hypothetical protein
MMKMNDTIYYKNLYTLAKTKKNMVCEHCGKPIMICNRCSIPGWYVMKKCVGKGFIHIEKGHFHHCSKINIVNSLPQEMNEVAFPVLTDDEKRRLEHYKGVKNE